jgi:hypothetical protein
MFYDENDLVIDREVADVNVRRRERLRRLRFYAPVVVSAALLASGGAARYWRVIHQSKLDQAHVVFISDGGSFGNPYAAEAKSPDPISDKVLNEALDSAVSEWSEALGREVKRPALNMANGDCGAEYAGVIACADKRGYAIKVTAIYYADPRTVMMHELGHLLGVPHIEGDKLMNAVYGGAVDHPTKFAVAIARVVSK